MSRIISTALILLLGACSPWNDAQKRIIKLDYPQSKSISPVGKSFTLQHDGKTYIMAFAEKIVSLRILKDSGTEIYTGDFIQSNNIISVRLDHLNEDKIPLPMVYNMHFVTTDGDTCLKELNKSQCWLTTNTK